LVSHLYISFDDSYRDNKSQEIVQNNPSKIKHLIGNRNKPEDYKKAIQDARELHFKINGKPLIFDMVVDYCSYD
jgi:nucleoside-diphosphate-sugar epimerase